MEVYKIRHIPTGYFVQPSRSSNHNSNIGKKGKIYEGNNIWARIQSRNEYHIIVVNQDYGIYEDLANRFPDNIRSDQWANYGRPRFYMTTNPEDFEKVFNW